MVRFLHTADWQLGMTRHYLSDDAQARYSAARLEAVRKLFRLAGERKAAFVVVSGDVFETNQVDRRTLAQAMDVLRSSPCPVYLLPGNHDPLDAASLYRQASFRERKPAQVHVIESATPIAVNSEVEIVGAPWSSKRPLDDLLQQAIRGLAPLTTRARVLVGHGAVDALVPQGVDPARISLAALECALDEGRIHYVALGDRHSKTCVGRSGRIWYAGSPEPTDFDEKEPGFALEVDLSPERVTVEPLSLAAWRFRRRDLELVGALAVAALERELEEYDSKAVTVLKLGLVGSLNLRQKLHLESVLERAREIFAAIVLSRSRSELHLLPDEDALAGLELSGFARVAAEELRAQARAQGPEAALAGDALALLLRLAERPT